ncbi:MAG: hypothetical protein ABJB02_03040 [Dokdonella sp.]
MTKQSFAVGCACLVASMQCLAGVSGVYDANNVLVGEYAEGVSIFHSIHGFRFSLDGSTGVVIPVSVDIGGATYDSALIYSTSNCTGQAYVTTSGEGNQSGGIMVNAGNKGLYYIPKTPSVTTVAIGSAFNGTACNPITLALFVVVPALLNDPATTGVPNSPYVPPLHLEMVPLSQFFQIFKDGFGSSFGPQAMTALANRNEAFTAAQS